MAKISPPAKTPWFKDAEDLALEIIRIMTPVRLRPADAKQDWTPPPRRETS